jgi:hypothetical protein
VEKYDNLLDTIFIIFSNLGLSHVCIRLGCLLIQQESYQDWYMNTILNRLST